MECSHLLGKLAVKLLDLLLGNESYRNVILSGEIDAERNYFLHRLCSRDTRLLPDQTSANVTNALLLEAINRHSSEYTSALRHSNRAKNTPLHLATASHNFDFVKALMFAYPKAAQHANLEGELPIHVLLKLTSLLGEEVSTLSTALSQFWTTCPSSITVRDGPTGLYPFQLAACCEWGPRLNRRDLLVGDDAAVANSTEGEEADIAGDAQWVDMIFGLILAAPQLI